MSNFRICHDDMSEDEHGKLTPHPRAVGDMSTGVLIWGLWWNTSTAEHRDAVSGKVAQFVTTSTFMYQIGT